MSVWIIFLTWHNDDNSIKIGGIIQTPIQNWVGSRKDFCKCHWVCQDTSFSPHGSWSALPASSYVGSSLLPSPLMIDFTSSIQSVLQLLLISFSMLHHTTCPACNMTFHIYVCPSKLQYCKHLKVYLYIHIYIYIYIFFPPGVSHCACNQGEEIQ